MAFDENELPKLIANAAIGRTTSQTIDYVKQNLQDALQRNWSFVVENATVNLLKNTKRRKAQFIVGQFDLLAPYDLPSIVSGGHVPGTNEKVNQKFPNMTKSWLKGKIEELRSKSARRDVELEELTKVYDVIKDHCADDESIGTGLTRANEKD